MTQQPYEWSFAGTCPSCGSPIYGRIRKAGHRRARPSASGDEVWEDAPEARRTCPMNCVLHTAPPITVTHT